MPTRCPSRAVGAPAYGRRPALGWAPGPHSEASRPGRTATNIGGAGTNAKTGLVAQKLDYDEFGVVLSDSNPGFQPFGCEPRGGPSWPGPSPFSRGEPRPRETAF